MVLITERSLCTVNIRNGTALARKTALIRTSGQTNPMLKSLHNLWLFTNHMYLSSIPSAITLAFVQCHHRFLSSLYNSEDFKSYALIIELMEVYMTQYGYKNRYSATLQKNTFLTSYMAVKLFQ